MAAPAGVPGVPAGEDMFLGAQAGLRLLVVHGTSLAGSRSALLGLECLERIHPRYGQRSAVAEADCGDVSGNSSGAGCVGGGLGGEGGRPVAKAAGVEHCVADQHRAGGFVQQRNVARGMARRVNYAQPPGTSDEFAVFNRRIRFERRPMRGRKLVESPGCRAGPAVRRHPSVGTRPSASQAASAASIRTRAPVSSRSAGAPCTWSGCARVSTIRFGSAGSRPNSVIVRSSRSTALPLPTSTRVRPSSPSIR